MHIVGLMAILLMLTGCRKEDPKPSLTESEKATALLTSGSGWVIQTVLVDGVDNTALFAGLKLSYTATDYSTVNGGVIWPASGTWKFTDDTGKNILRSDGMPITLNEITSTKLVLGLTWSKTTLAGGRENSVAGNHVFTFGH